MLLLVHDLRLSDLGSGSSHPSRLDVCGSTRIHLDKLKLELNRDAARQTSQRER